MRVWGRECDLTPGHSTWLDAVVSEASLDHWTPSAHPVPRRLERALAVCFVLEFMRTGRMPGGLGAGAPQVGAASLAWACDFACWLVRLRVRDSRPAEQSVRVAGSWRSAGVRWAGFDNNAASRTIRPGGKRHNV